MSGIPRCVILILVLAVATPAAAQRRSAFSLEGSVGRGTGSGGGERVDRSGLALDGTIAWRGRSDLPSGPILGGSFSWQGRRGDTDWCKPQANGSCVLVYPTFTMVHVLGGWELARGAGASLRVLGGPGLFVQELGRGSVGFTGRIDLATPVRGGVALMGSGRVGLTAPRGDGHTLSAATIGVRIH